MAQKLIHTSGDQPLEINCKLLPLAKNISALQLKKELKGKGLSEFKISMKKTIKYSPHKTKGSVPGLNRMFCIYICQEQVTGRGKSPV